jgi:hypothetical protein
MGGGHLAVGKIIGQAPDFFLAIEAVKNKISVFVLAVGRGANVILGTRRRSWVKPNESW